MNTQAHGPEHKYTTPTSSGPPPRINRRAQPKLAGWRKPGHGMATGWPTRCSSPWHEEHRRHGCGRVRHVVRTLARVKQYYCTPNRFNKLTARAGAPRPLMELKTPAGEEARKRFTRSGAGRPKPALPGHLARAVLARAPPSREAPCAVVAGTKNQPDRPEFPPGQLYSLDGKRTHVRDVRVHNTTSPRQLRALIFPPRTLTKRAPPPPHPQCVYILLLPSRRAQGSRHKKPGWACDRRR